MLAAMLGTIIAMSSFQTVYATKQDVEAAKKKVSSIEEEKKKVQATIKNLEGLRSGPRNRRSPIPAWRWNRRRQRKINSMRI